MAEWVCVLQLCALANAQVGGLEFECFHLQYSLLVVAIGFNFHGWAPNKVYAHAPYLFGHLCMDLV